MKATLDYIIREANIHNLEINELTVSAIDHAALAAEVDSDRYYFTSPEDCRVVTYKGVIVHRRECKGCCRHG